MSHLPSVPALTHMGIYTDHPDAMRDFYVRTFGMVVSDTGQAMLFKRRIIFLTADRSQHHQLVLVAREAGDPQAGAMFQLSFKLPNVAELRASVARATTNGATDMQGMNHGNAWSMYCRDPDGNRVEIYMDTDWYLPQPFAEPLSLAMSDAELAAQTARLVQSRPGALPVAEWSRQMQQRIETQSQQL